MATSPPRWQTMIEKAISQYKKQTIFQVSTISTSPNHFGHPIPRVRTMVFRSFLTPPNNPPSLPLIITTTDIRTPKVTQLAPIDKPSSSPAPMATNVTEVVWWIEGTMEQYRIAGRVYFLPDRSAAAYERLRTQFFDAMRDRVPHGHGAGVVKVGSFDWDETRVETFRALSPELQATWCRPDPPGGPLKGGQDEARKWPVKIEEPREDMPKDQYEEAKRLWEMALSNYALVAIDPLQVDVVELGVTPNRRTLFTRQEGSQTWTEEELVP